MIRLIRKESRWYVGSILLFLLATNAGYLSSWFRTPPSHRYTGIGLESVGDKLVYYSMIEQGREGMLFMKNRHTSEDQRALLFSPHWYLVGMTSQFLGISPVASYHMYRLLFILVFLWLLYLFILKLYATERERHLAYATVLFASGLGWYFLEHHPEIVRPDLHWMYTFQQHPVDIYVTEMNTFINTVQSPLFIVSYILLLLNINMFLNATLRSSTRTTMLLFGTTLLAALIHPYDIIILSAVLGSWSVWYLARFKSWQPLWRLIPVALALLLSVSYWLWIFSHEPALAGWLEQNITISPRLSMYLWGMGIFGPLWALGLWALYRSKEKNPWWVFVAIWSSINWLLIYLPFQTNRRFSTAWFIPLSLMGFYAIRYLLRRMKSFVLQSALLTCFLILGFSGVLWRVVVYVTYTPSLAEKYSVYHDPYVADLLSFAQKNFKPDDIMLASEGFITMTVGAFAPVRLYAGHGHQTANFLLKNQQAEWFFAPPQTPTALNRREDFLRSARIDHIVLYKPALKDYAWLLGARFLNVVFVNEGFVVLNRLDHG